MSRPQPPNATIADLANGLGWEDARDLVRIFIDGFDAMLASLASADREERRRAAHSLKSSARIVGLISLSEQMAELEERLTDSRADVSPKDIRAAREKFETAAPSLRTFCAPTRD